MFIIHPFPFFPKVWDDISIESRHMQRGMLPIVTRYVTSSLETMLIITLKLGYRMVVLPTWHNILIKISIPNNCFEFKRCQVMIFNGKTPFQPCPVFSQSNWRRGSCCPMASYKQVILLPDYWSHLLRTISARWHVGISARSSIVMSCAHLPKYKVKKIMTFHYKQKKWHWRIQLWCTYTTPLPITEVPKPQP